MRRFRLPTPRTNAGTFIELSWRPEVGAQVGRLQVAPEALEVAPGDHFTRLFVTGSAAIRLLTLVPRPPTVEEPEPGSKRVSRLELSARVTAWRLRELGATRAQTIVGAAWPINDNTMIKLDWESARKPPAFRYESSVSLGVGLSRE